MTPTMPMLLSLFLASACTASPVQQNPHEESSPRLPQATLPEMCIQLKADLGSLERLHPFSMSTLRLERKAELLTSWQAKLQSVEFEKLSRRHQIDWLLLSDEVSGQLLDVDIERTKEAEIAPLLAFATPLVTLLENRANRTDVDPEAAAHTFAKVVADIEGLRNLWASDAPKFHGSQARRASSKLASIRRALTNWYNYSNGYDPLFSWWVAEPWNELNQELADFGPYLEKVIGGLNPEDKDALVGDPIGEAALLHELAKERIPYSPAELIAIAEREFKWCNEKRVAAAHAMGLDGDWRKAQLEVKKLHAAPGGQPTLIRELAEEAVTFLEDRDLVTIPELAKESWRMGMMSPERQKFSPYFTGGEVISIAFPTDGMDHESKLQSMRGNNRPYSRATVHHELIPGHHLQGYMRSRWNPHRGMFSTPFLGEGGALYWELRLWDFGFANTPEEEIGMLFWRSHRCARIIFSLNFQLGNWTPEQCVDFLVKHVGHERKNAEAEVRRSIQGGYGPLYQCAYMLGGLQLSALHEELVVQGDWSEKEFHDAVLRQGSIPIEIIRAALGEAPLSSSLTTSWRF